MASNKDNIVFNNLNFTIKKNKVTAIVGSTGIGKTSLVKLLLRLYEPQNGNILIGSENIKNLKLKDLRKSIGLAHAGARNACQFAPYTVP